MTLTVNKLTLRGILEISKTILKSKKQIKFSNKWYNIFTGNLGYHTAHHVKPGLHWSMLPEFHKSIEDKIPAHLYRQPCIPFKWFPEENNFNVPTSQPSKATL